MKDKKSKLTFMCTVPNSLVIKMFEQEGYKHADTVSKADFVVFPGGSDVIPLLYGEKPIPSTTYNLNRDLVETKIFRRTPFTKPKVGICRGAQFLCVMNGGGLWQDVDRHTVNHVLWDLETKRLIPSVTSTHHQMMRPPTSAVLVGTAKEATRKEAEQEVLHCNPNKEYNDPEVVWFPHSHSLCFQPHPEYSHESTKDYFFQKFDKYILGKIA